MVASPQILDFAKGLGNVKDDEIPIDPKTGRPFVLTKKQIKRRALRDMKRRAALVDLKVKRQSDVEDLQALELAYKPIEEWDEEELARGRPRAVDGTFRGRPPSWMNRAIHEKAMETFKEQIRGKMRINAVDAVRFLGEVLGDDRTDEKGKPVVSASTKTQAAMFLVEHLLGKPKQEVNADISVRLQGVLAQAMVAVTPDGAVSGPGSHAGEPGKVFEPTPLPEEALRSLDELGPPEGVGLEYSGRDRLYGGIVDADSSPYLGSDWQEDDDVDGE